MRLRNVLSLVLALALSACAWAADAPPRHDFPRVGPYEVLTGDLHMHTINSDGKLTTRQRVEESYRLGYDAIAITDHGKPKAYRVARYVGEPLGLVVICGLESGINKKEHLNLIGVPADYQPKDSHNWAENPGEGRAFYQDELAKLGGCGAFVIYNHPHVGFREPMKWGIAHGLIQGIEVKNGVVGKGWATEVFHGADCYPFAFDWALENNLTIMADTDAHGARSTDGWTCTLILATARTPEAVMDAFRNRRTAAWFNGMVWGRKELLTDLVAAAVQVNEPSSDNLTITNRCPIPLKGKVVGKVGALPDTPFELAPYGQATIGLAASPGDVSVKWDNLWISPRDNLQTTLKVQ